MTISPFQANTTALTPIINRGMGLDEILLYQYNPSLFSSLLTTDTKIHVDSLNPDLEMGVTNLLSQLENTPDLPTQQILAAAIGSELNDIIQSLSSMISSDLTNQTAARDKASQLAIIDQLVPYERGEQLSVNAAKIISAVSTDKLKEILK